MSTNVRIAWTVVNCAVVAGMVVDQLRLHGRLDGVQWGAGAAALLFLNANVWAT